MQKRTDPVVGDAVEYEDHDGNIVGGILAEVWPSELTGNLRARVCDFPSEYSDLDAGRQLYYDKLRLPAGQFHKLARDH